MRKAGKSRGILQSLVARPLSVCFPVLGLLLILSQACTFPAPTQTPAPNESIGAVKRESPEVWHNDSQVQAVDWLFPDDLIKVRNEGAALLEFGSGLFIRLFNTTDAGGVNGTMISHDPESPIIVQLTLFAGGLTGRLIKPGNQVAIDTPGGARILVRGTKFFVTYNPLDGLTTAGNFGGIMGIVAGGVSVVIPSGYYLEVPSGEPPGTPLPLGFSIDKFEVQALDEKSPILALADLVSPPPVQAEAVITESPHAEELPAVQITATPEIDVTAETAVSEVPTLTPVVADNAAIPVICTMNTLWPVYYVLPGDTLFSIAQGSGTTYQALMSANCLRSPTIYVGQALRVPVIPVKPIPGSSLTLAGTVVNDDGGSATTGDFQVFIDDFPVAWEFAHFLEAGPHQVQVSGIPGYSFGSWGGDCESNGAVSLVAGEAKACYILLDDIAPTLTLNQSVINDNGGSAAQLDLRTFVGDSAAIWGVPLTLSAGSHIAKAEEASGYSAGPWSGDCDSKGFVSLSVGENKTCSIVYDDIAPVLTLVNTVKNDQGGAALKSDFQVFIGETHAEWDVPQPLMAGNHLVYQAGPPGYTAAGWGGDCNSDGSIFLSIGENKTCTIVNDDVPVEMRGTLIVIKIVVNDDRLDDKVAGDFSFSVNGGEPIRFEEDGRNEMTVEPGVYSVTEPSDPYYFASYDNCTERVIPSGGSVTCFIVNDDTEPPAQVAFSLLVN